MVQLLLTNCLDLLNNEPRPDDHLEIMTSSHYLLAEVYSLTNQNETEEVLDNTERCESASPVCDEDEFLWPKVIPRFIPGSCAKRFFKHFFSF